MNAMLDGVAVQDMAMTWATVEEWSHRLQVTAQDLRERLDGYPSRPAWAHEEEFDYVTDTYAEPHVREACADLLPARGVLSGR